MQYPSHKAYPFSSIIGADVFGFSLGYDHGIACNNQRIWKKNIFDGILFKTELQDSIQVTCATPIRKNRRGALTEAFNATLNAELSIIASWVRTGDSSGRIRKLFPSRPKTITFK